MLGCGSCVPFRTGPYGGLANQGCTCYMNAVIQQLFHAEHCRAQLLVEAVDVPFYTPLPDEPPPAEQPDTPAQDADHGSPPRRHRPRPSSRVRLRRSPPPEDTPGACPPPEAAAPPAPAGGASGAAL